METILLIVNGLLSGGFIAIITVKASRKKAIEEAEKIELSNADHIVKLQKEYFINPLRTEITELKKEVSGLRTAIEKIAYCPHKDFCPVTDALKQK